MQLDMSLPVRGTDGAANETVRRVLVYRLGSLGDTLVALPSLHMVERAFPKAERRMLTNIPVSSKAPAAAAVLADSGLIHGYERYTVGMRNPLQLLALAWRIRRFRPQVLIYMAAARGVDVARRDAKFFRLLCGIPRLIGVPDTDDAQRWRTEPDGTLEPEAARLSRNLAELGDAVMDDPENWDMRLTEAEFAAADAALAPVAGRRILAVSVGTKVQSKDWGRDNWRTLLAGLAQMYPGYGLILSGAPEERAVSEFAAEGWQTTAGAGPVVNLCGSLSPRESAAAFSRSAVFIGHDSGPMHLAASVGTPCVAIFAARNIPRVWFPFGRQHRVIYHRVDCGGCGLEVCVEQRKKCLLSITVGEVLDAVRGVLPAEDGNAGTMKLEVL
jgi:ADP-heptose:LPS heptosyltransferase